jgi:hypothetical protein
MYWRKPNVVLEIVGSWHIAKLRRNAKLARFWGTAQMP